MASTPQTSNTTRLLAAAPDAYLKATILSAYDLKSREPPACVSLTLGARTVSTGPPAQRHKDRNSFKFTTPNSNGGPRPSNEVLIAAPLSELYESTLEVDLVYTHQPLLNLRATYELKQLKIHETTWLILTLEPKSISTALSTNDDEITEVPPTLRLQLTLCGPYRPEIAAVVRLSQKWFGLVDKITDKTGGIVSKIPTVDPKFVLIPAVPVVTCLVVCAPILIGILVLGLPVFLPVAVMAVLLGVALVAMACFLYASTKPGRAQVETALYPLVHTLASTPTGQTLLYQTGPRPTPVQLTRSIMPDGPYQRLFLSLGVDAMGSASYLLPVVGEAFDLGWAPAQTILIMALYDEVASPLKYVSFAEEALPFTDVVPSATLGWLVQFGLPWVFGKKESEATVEEVDETTTPAVAVTRPS